MGVASRVRFHRRPGLLSVTGTPVAAGRFWVAALLSAFPLALGSLSDARLEGETVRSGVGDPWREQHEGGRVRARQPPQARLRRPRASGALAVSGRGRRPAAHGPFPRAVTSPACSCVRTRLRCE